jgi:hypothetical protein
MKEIQHLLQGNLLDLELLSYVFRVLHSFVMTTKKMIVKISHTTYLKS